jgi:hypothetical protein
VFTFALPFSTPSFTLSGTHCYFNITPILTALFLVNWLVEADFKAKYNRVKTMKLTYPFFAVISFYLLYIIGITYSSNLDFAKTDILLKVPFFVLPLVILTLNSTIWKPKTSHNLLFTFAVGNLLVLCISLINSAVHCEEGLSITCFHYYRASLFFHPSYASMYYCFSFVIVLYFLLTRQLHSWKKVLAWIMFLLFSAEIVLLDSRTGLLTFAIVMFAFACYIFAFNRKNGLHFVLYMSLLVGIFTSAYLILPTSSNRFFIGIRQVKDKISPPIEEVQEKTKIVDGKELTLGRSRKTLTTKEKMEQLSEDVRLGRIDTRAQIWANGMEVFKEHPVFGVGIGDVKDALMEKFILYDFERGQERNFNAHNQFLQIMVTFGMVGLAVFLVFWASIFWVSWKKRNVFLFFFGLIGLVNFWTESMFEKQIGVMFFAFFFSVLCYIAASPNSSERGELPTSGGIEGGDYSAL